MAFHPIRPTNLVLLLRREAEYQRGRDGEEDSAELARYLEMAIDEIEELQEAIKGCPIGPCPVLAHFGLKELV